MTTEVEFKSPDRKLVRFFKESRDKWKVKHAERKRQCRSLQGQVRAVEASRERWKAAAKQAREEARQLRLELERVQKRLTDNL